MKTQLRALVAATFAVLALAAGLTAPDMATAAPAVSACLRPCHF